MPGTSRSGGNRSVGNDMTVNDGGPTKPKSLTKGAAVKWNDLITQLPMGVLRAVDVHQLSLLAELLSQAEQLATLIASDPTDEKTRRLYLGTVDRITRLSPAFGLSPTDRKRSRIEPAVSDDETDMVAALLKRGGLN